MVNEYKIEWLAGDWDKDQADRKTLVAYLEKEGFKDIYAGGNCPFQIEANHKSGISVYFRSRGCTASLCVYKEHLGKNPNAVLPKDSERLWCSEYDCPDTWDMFGAGWIDFAEAYYLFYSLWCDAKEQIE